MIMNIFLFPERQEVCSVHVMAEIDAKIKAQGDKVRELKAAKSSKDVIDPEVKTLLGLKAEFKVQLIFL